MFVNRGLSGKPFLICERCGRNVTKPKQGEHKNAYGKACNGTVKRTALAHRVRGEALAISFVSSSDFMLPDDFIFYETLKYALLEGINRALAIERRDLGGQVRRAVHETTAMWEILIVDNVPGGAGYIGQIFSENGLRRAFAEAEKIVNCECAPESTCYSCLRNMWNQQIHAEMRRDHILTFLRALQARLEGHPVLLGMTAKHWFGRYASSAEKIVLAMKNLSNDIAQHVINLSSKTHVTLILDKEASIHERRCLEAWCFLWGKRVDVRLSNVSSMELGAFEDNAWSLVRHAVQSLNQDTSLDGAELFEDQEARRLVDTLLQISLPYETGTVQEAEAIALRRGEKTSEGVLFGHLFEEYVDQLEIEDRFLYDSMHLERLRAWLRLLRNESACITIKTLRSRDKAENQRDIFSKLQREFGGKHTLRIRYAERNGDQRHDRRISIVQGKTRTEVVLPYGLAFIGPDGTIIEDTHAFVLR
jgi:hypothetical protein